MSGPRLNFGSVRLQYAGCLWLLVACVGVGFSWADCNCRQGTGIPALAVGQVLPPAPPPPLPEPPAPIPDPQFQGPSAVPHPAPQPSAMPAPPVSPPEAPQINRFGVAPPPGTLGRTYQRPSRLVDDDQHPRFAAVEVHLPEEVDVSARGLKSKWTGKVWRLEAETPLLPGVPHVYAVKAERDLGNGEKHVEYRWVRLIMGRVVDLEF
jgi:hypothetical protein